MGWAVSWAPWFACCRPVLARLAFPALCFSVRPPASSSGHHTETIPRSSLLSPLWGCSWGSVFGTTHRVPFMAPLSPGRNPCLILVPRIVVIFLSNRCVCFYLLDTGNRVTGMVSFSFWLLDSSGTNLWPTRRTWTGPSGEHSCFGPISLHLVFLSPLRSLSYSNIQNWERPSQNQ